MTQGHEFPAQKISRRRFTQLTGLLGGSFIVGFSLWEKDTNAVTRKGSANYEPNVFFSFSEDGKMTFVCHRSEMGQGIRTSLLQMVCDELEVPMEQVTLKQALGDKKYGDQNTDGSRSIKGGWEKLRTMAASIREGFTSAAAQKWRVDPAVLKNEAGYVLNTENNKKISYTDLLSTIKEIELNKNPKLKSTAQFKLIRKKITSVDNIAFVTGEAAFGMDIELPDMVYASLRRSPTITGELASYDDTKALKLPGVLRTLKINGTEIPYNTSDAVAVFATNTWEAMEGCRLLEVRWSEKNKIASDKEIFEQMYGQVDNLNHSTHEKIVVYEHGNKISSIKSWNFERTYETPFLVHAPMEPLVATAWYKKDRLEIWAPCQDPQNAMNRLAKLLDLKVENIIFHVTFLGGGFGRKSQADFIIEAVLLSKEIKKPVKVTWTREDEIKHGFYHPGAVQKIRAELTTNNKPKSWHHHSVFPSIQSIFQEDPKTPSAGEITMGAGTLPYEIDNILVDGSTVKAPFRIGWMRSVHNIQHSFAINSFVDELAEKAKKDPIDYSLDLIGRDRILTIADQDTSRLKAVIKRLKNFSNWEKMKKDGKILGFSHHFSFYSYLAVAVELDPSAGKDQFQVKNVYCVMDCGQFVNRLNVEAQIQGSVAFSLSIIKYGKITFEGGVVQQSNFHDYPVIRNFEMPKVHVDLIENEFAPSGVGEPGVPAFLPAVTNALSRWRGERIVKLPLS